MLENGRKTQAGSQRNYFNAGKGDFNVTAFNTRSNDEVDNRRSVGGAAGKGMTNNYVGHVG